LWKLFPTDGVASVIVDNLRHVGDEMLLRSVEIRNYLSLEHVQLEGLGPLNILIGRNNSGKSAVFGALSFLARSINGQGQGRHSGEVEAVLPARNLETAFEMKLDCELHAKDREDFIGMLPPASAPGERRRLVSGSLFRKIDYYFCSPPGRPDLLHLRLTRILSEDGKMAVVQRMKKHSDERVANPVSQLRLFSWLKEPKHGEKLTHDRLDLEANKEGVGEQNVSSNQLGVVISEEHPSLSWLQNLLAKHMMHCFFFNHARRSLSRSSTQQTDRLAQDGSNLAQVLDTIGSHSRRKLEAIEQFVHAAVPGLGTLQTPRRAKETDIGFKSPDDAYFVHLHDMGGGIEQLLMVATVLQTTGTESTIFLEEPESHLHPGVQRFLLEKVAQEGRQVFLTTHSPVILSAVPNASIYQVRYSDRTTSIRKVKADSDLSQLLADVGVRNSDVLLSDAVLFVEGPSDRDSILTWSTTLGSSLTEHNITVLTMGGGEFAERQAPLRSDVLHGISQKAPVPHLFLLDRDERGQAELDRLHQRLGALCHVLKAREIENYMLVPRALKAAMLEKCTKGSPAYQTIELTSEKALQELIRGIADGLYSLSLVKHLRAEIPGFQGGLFSREMAMDLVPMAMDPTLPTIVVEKLQTRMAGHLAEINLNLPAIVEARRKDLNALWSDEAQRLRLVPGEEVLKAVFEHFGLQFNKTQDNERIARLMKAEEIDPEIQELIHRAAALPAVARETQMVVSQ
jgi:predicted ATPase